MKFAGMSKLSLEEGRTTEYVLSDLVGSPVLMVVPSGEHNPALQEISIRRGREIAGKQLTTIQVHTYREEDRKLYARFVIKGWRGFKDEETGRDIPFSVANAEELLRQMPDWLFDKLRIFTADPSNFVQRAFDLGELAGNSGTVSSGD